MTDGSRKIPIDGNPSSVASASATALATNAGLDDQPVAVAINGTALIARSPTYHQAGELPSSRISTRYVAT